MTIWTKFGQKGHFQTKTKKSEQYHWILEIQIGPATKFQLKLIILIFWTKFARKNKANEHYYWILHIRISLGIKFQLKLIILTFATKFAQKGHFWLKTKKVNTVTEFRIFELIWVSSFTLNWQFWFFWTKFAQKRYFRSKTEKPFNSAYSN